MIVICSELLLAGQPVDSILGGVTLPRMNELSMRQVHQPQSGSKWRHVEVPGNVDPDRHSKLAAFEWPLAYLTNFGSQGVQDRDSSLLGPGPRHLQPTELLQ